MDSKTTDKLGAFLVGASTLVGGLLVGKVVIDLVQEKVPSPIRDTAFIDSVRLVASIVGISVSIMQLPSAWVEAQKFVKTGALPVATP